jgi:hypothetical protein
MYLVHLMMPGPRFLSEGSMMKLPIFEGFPAVALVGKLNWKGCVYYEIAS